MKVVNCHIVPIKAVKKAIIDYKGKYIEPDEIIENTKNVFKARWSNGAKEMYMLLDYKELGWHKGTGWRMMLHHIPDFTPINFFLPFRMDSINLHINIIELFKAFEDLHGKIL